MKFIERLVYLEKKSWLYPIVSKVLLLLTVEVPRSVIIGKNLHLNHRAMCTVIHPLTKIGNNVTIYHGVTIGSAKPWDADVNNLLKQSGGGYYVEVQDDVILCAGCKILFNKKIVIGKGTIVGANAVLTCSTGENEIWAGVPAKCVKKK